MAEFMKDFVDKEIDNQIKVSYPHLRYPIAVYARVTNVIHDSNLNTFVNLKILDKNMNIDEEFPEIPFVQTSIDFSKKDIATIVLMYGDCGSPYIVGRYLNG